MRIKEIIKKKIIGSYNLSDYVTIGVPTSPKNTEYTCLCFEKQKIKVNAHCVLYDPAMVGVFFEDQKPKNIVDKDNIFFLEYFDNRTNSSIGSIKLQFENVISLDNTQKIYLFIAKDANLRLTTLRLKIINQILFWKLKRQHNSFLSAFNAKYYRVLLTLFTQPRLVRLLTVSSHKNDHKHFPIDLYFHIKDHVIFGVRNSNNASELFKKGTSLCISDVLMKHKSTVYSLGKFGKGSNDNLKFVVSEELELKIPDLFFSYVEIKLKEIIQYNSQSIYIADVIHQSFNIKREKEFLLSHIQLLRNLKQPFVNSYKI